MASFNLCASLDTALDGPQNVALLDGPDPKMVPCDPPETRFSCRTFLLYVGPGWLMSLAYLDPGNLESDLQNGAFTGYALVWVLLLCTAAGFILQILAARLGTVTGHNLAETCRMHYSRPTAFTIWIMAEIAIIGSDIQEVVGTAIALNVLFGWRLWVGSLVTGLDTFTFLLIHHFGTRALEFFIFALILVIMGCFFLNYALMPPPTFAVVEGFVPSCPSYAILQMVGTVGAVIMPHNIYLHSSLVTSRGVDRGSELHLRQANRYNMADCGVALSAAFLINAALQTSFAHGFFHEACASTAGIPLACHPGAAGPNPSCSGTSCDPCKTATGHAGWCDGIGLESAGDALSVLFGSNGQLARKVFAVGLLAAGQASTMTGTIAGQVVMEGFLQWRVPLWVRTLITRCVALGPAVTVAVLTSGNPGLNSTVSEWLNILQSVQLPFALLPILHFTSESGVMGDNFALKLHFQAICWLLAASVIGVNIYLVIDATRGSSPVVMVPVTVFFTVYASFLGVIASSDIQKAYRALCACCVRST